MAEIKGENKKSIPFNIKDMNLQERGKFVNLYTKAEMSNPMDWASFAECCLIATDLTENQLMDLTDVDIILVAKEAYLIINNKKKDKK